MDTANAIIIEIITHLEQAKNAIESLRVAKVEEQIDGRALSIAVTHLETCQLWVANARK